MDYQTIKNETLGYQIDIDYFPKEQPYQCWDFVMYVAEKYLDGNRIHCGITTYVIDIANTDTTNGILNWCDKVPLTVELQQGDICIWGICESCPYSHIAMYDHDNGQNAVYFLGQNQPYPKVTVCQIDVSGIVAVYRPKALHRQESGNVMNYTPDDFINESGQFFPNGAIKIRKAPSLHGEDTGVRYVQGESVYYDGYVKREGYCWLSWIGEQSGERRWMSCGELDENGTNKYPYGAFG